MTTKTAHKARTFLARLCRRVGYMDDLAAMLGSYDPTCPLEWDYVSRHADASAKLFYAVKEAANEPTAENLLACCMLADTVQFNQHRGQSLQHGENESRRERHTQLCDALELLCQ